MRKLLTLTLLAILVLAFAFTVAASNKPVCSDHVCKIVVTYIGDDAILVEKCCWAEYFYKGSCVEIPGTRQCMPIS